MKKLLLLSALFIFACSRSGDGSDISLDFDCPDFDGSTSQSDARNMAIDYDSEDYYSLVSEYGEPISEGYFVDGVLLINYTSQISNYGLIKVGISSSFSSAISKPLK